MLVMAGTLGVSDRSFSQSNLYAIQTPFVSWSLTGTPGSQSSSGISLGSFNANIGNGSLGAASVTLSLGGAVPGGLFYDPSVTATGTASNTVAGPNLTGNASSKIIYEFALIPLIAGPPPSPFTLAPAARHPLSIPAAAQPPPRRRQVLELSLLAGT